MNEKEQWVIDYLIEQKKKSNSFIDVLDNDFVNAYLDKFDDRYMAMTIGAPKCPSLSRLLGIMYKKNLLKRYSQGVRSGLRQDGAYPKWVYSYYLPNK